MDRERLEAVEKLRKFDRFLYISTSPLWGFGLAIFSFILYIALAATVPGVYPDGLGSVILAVFTFTIVGFMALSVRRRTSNVSNTDRTNQ